MPRIAEYTQCEKYLPTPLARLILQMQKLGRRVSSLKELKKSEKNDKWQLTLTKELGRTGWRSRFSKGEFFFRALPNRFLFPLTACWLLILLVTAAKAQPASVPDSVSANVSRPDTMGSKGRGEYALVAYVGGGMSYYATTIGIPDGSQNVHVNRRGFPFSLRLMWHPDHRLRMGIETGWIEFYGYSSQIAGKAGKVKLTATPILLVWSMPLGKRINLFAGTGTYLMHSRLHYEGEVKTHELSMGWMAAASYVQPISKNIGLAAELKWMNATETEDASFMAQLQLVWKFLRW